MRSTSVILLKHNPTALSFRVAQGPRRAFLSSVLAFALAVAGTRPSAAGPEPPPAAPCPLYTGKPHPLPMRALDVAFLGPDRLVVLDAAEVALFALADRHVTLLSRRTLPGPLEVVRAPGGLLLGSEREAAVWAMTSRSAQPVLFVMEGSELVERQRAEAMPFPGCPRGLRFRSGTSLIEGDVDGLGAGPFLDVVAAEVLFAVSPEGRLLTPERPEAAPRVGPTLAPLWPGLIAASLPSAPGQDDAVVVLAPWAAEPVLSCPAPGPVRAMAARIKGDSARLAVAFDETEGRSSLLVFDVPRPRP
jgi:hypothetical protein